MTSLIGDTGLSVAGACQASGVAAAAGVAANTWAATWLTGGRVRPWRPTHVARGRAPYVEWSVASGTFSNENIQEGGMARLTIKVAAIVRATSQGDAEQISANILLTALSAIRLLGGGYCGAGDSLADAVRLRGFSDVWRRESSIEVQLDYNYSNRAFDPGVVIANGNAWSDVDWTETGGVLIAVPAGATIDTIRIEPVDPWDGVGASLAVYADPDPVVFFTLNQAVLNDMAIAQEARGPFTGCTAVRVVPTPGTGAVGGKVRVYVYSH